MTGIPLNGYIGGNVMAFDHQQIEKKWQKYWLENKTFKTSDDSSKPKYYALDMFHTHQELDFMSGIQKVIRQQILFHV